MPYGRPGDGHIGYGVRRTGRAEEAVVVDPSEVTCHIDARLTAFAALKEPSASDLKQFLESRADELAGVEVADAGLDFDIDTPADYQRAREWYFKSG